MTSLQANKKEICETLCAFSRSKTVRKRAKNPIWGWKRENWWSQKVYQLLVVVVPMMRPSLQQLSFHVQPLNHELPTKKVILINTNKKKNRRETFECSTSQEAWTRLNCSKAARFRAAISWLRSRDSGENPLLFRRKLPMRECTC